ncbi:MAG: hypothetical protein RR636_08860 [Clostridium sp.]|uniref:hypothetical protein n=1 Tax=Clostridium sp. TaxID=1506 RepID=UPI003062E6C7
MKINNNYIIKIKVDNYENLFYDFDFAPINDRDLRDDIDTFILDKAIDIHKSKKHNVSLEIYLPKTNSSAKTEALALEGIYNYYNSKIEIDNITLKAGRKRLVYYILLSFSISILLYISNKFFHGKIISTILDTSATVILWQAVSLIFIESKNYSVKRNINRIFSDMKVYFKYIDFNDSVYH